MRDEYAPPKTAEERARDMLESVREADLQVAVRKEHERAAKAGMRITDGEALQAVDIRIATDGAERVLPHWARAVARVTGDTAATAEYDRRLYPAGRKEVVTVSQFDAPEASEAGSEDDVTDESRQAIRDAALTEYSALDAKTEKTREDIERMSGLAQVIKQHHK